MPRLAPAFLGCALALTTVSPALAATQPVPDLPALPVIDPASVSLDFSPVSVPAYATSTSWVSNFSEGSTVTVDAAPYQGTPLLADWNGDGVPSPGVFNEGSWLVSNDAVGRAALTSISLANALTDGVRDSFTSFPGLGRAGDVPVTGDVDGDSRLDLGVFRSGAWVWRTAAGDDLASRFGPVDGTPIVGDWDGDGTDDLGVVLGATWYLQLPSGTREFKYGLATDSPLVGDWDGDGVDSPAVFRAPSTWITSKEPVSASPTTTLTFTVPAGATPLVGSQPSPSCPTVSQDAELTNRVTKAAVTPTGSVTSPGGASLLAALQDGVRYAVTADLTEHLAGRTDAQFYDPLSVSPSVEKSIRRPANSALAAATLATTAGYVRANGLSRADLVSYASWHVRSVACSHRALSPGGWGGSWQSALWAATVAQAAWLIWDEISPQARAYVQSMLVFEADAAAERGPRYFRDRDGNELTPGDSLSDEVSWDLLAPTIATAMLPKHPRAAYWMDSAASMAIAAFSRPSNLVNPQVVNGLDISVALPGTNANEDGSVTNHGVVNPDYAQNVQHLWWAVTLLRSADRDVPESFFLNADIVYRSLSTIEFASPPYDSPGGTVYSADGSIYYPMGPTWGTNRPATFAGVDAFAYLYAAKDTGAKSFLALHADAVRAQQQRFTTGQFYAPGRAEDSYALGRDQYALSQVALAWWASSWKSSPLPMNVSTELMPGISLRVK